MELSSLWWRVGLDCELQAIPFLRRRQRNSLFVAAVGRHCLPAKTKRVLLSLLLFSPVIVAQPDPRLIFYQHKYDRVDAGVIHAVYFILFLCSFDTMLIVIFSSAPILLHHPLRMDRRHWWRDRLLHERKHCLFSSRRRQWSHHWVRCFPRWAAVLGEWYNKVVFVSHEDTSVIDL